MKLVRHQPPDRDEVVYTLTISGGELMRAKLYKFDDAVLRDCSSEDATIADSLLGLELLARRIEEAATLSAVGGKEKP